MRIESTQKTTVHAEVLLSSGTTQLTREYKIENVTQWGSYASGYYEIKTEVETYCFPISRTTLRITKE